MAAILILDDQADQRRVIRHLLDRLYPGIRIDEYTQAVSDLNSISNIDEYNLVLLNGDVGGQDTLPWMRLVRKQHPKYPQFIILSPITTLNPMVIQRVVRAVKMGAMNFYFKKNMVMEHLIKDIGRVMDDLVPKPEPAPDDKEPETFHEMRLKKAKEAEAEAMLALDMLQGHKQWPFTMDAILGGKAQMGRYRIDSFLGEDNTASTFRAYIPNVKAPIALKIINRLRVGDKTIPLPFSSRFKTISQRKHPNVIRLLTFEVIDDRMVVALEYLRSGTLEDRLKEGPLSEAEAIKYFRQLMDGMAALHEVDIELHQIVPRQLMFRDDDNLVITQIGLLNMLHALSEIAGDWPLPFSTPVYTTPEDIQKKKTDVRSDIYLAGLIGYEMLAGKPAFSGGSDQDIMYAQAAEPAPPLTGVNPTLQKLITKMLEKLPENRPQTAAEVLEVLKGVG